MAALLIVGGVVGSLSQGGGGLGFGELRNGKITIYGKGQVVPEATIHIGSALKTHQRRGFYRIGLLPGLRVEDVTVEILKPESVLDALAETDGHLQALGNGKRVELYHLRVVVAGASATTIKADRLVMDSDGVWKLKGNITLSYNGQTNTLKNAQLTVAGVHAGRLTFENLNGPGVINLLSIAPTNLTSRNH